MCPLTVCISVLSEKIEKKRSIKKISGIVAGIVAVIISMLIVFCICRRKIRKYGKETDIHI